MKKIEAIKYLVLHDEYREEWTGAGMWEAVLDVMEKDDDSEITEEYLKELLLKAKNF